MIVLYLLFSLLFYCGFLINQEIDHTLFSEHHFHNKVWDWEIHRCEWFWSVELEGASPTGSLGFVRRVKWLEKMDVSLTEKEKMTMIKKSYNTIFNLCFVCILIHLRWSRFALATYSIHDGTRHLNVISFESNLKFTLAAMYCISSRYI